jgi:nicotinamide-nucleotide amidase
MPDYSNPDLVDKLFAKLEKKSWMVVTAESCTGGMIATAITEKPGSSAYFERGFVTYSNQAKTDCLGVSPETLEKYGAVSAQTAVEMAEGALENSKAKVAVAVTGVAGPGGGTPQKPVGLVHIGFAIRGGIAQSKAFNFNGGDRQEIRLQTTRAALQTLLSIC